MSVLFGTAGCSWQRGAATTNLNEETRPPVPTLVMVEAELQVLTRVHHAYRPHGPAGRVLLHRRSQRRLWVEVQLIPCHVRPRGLPGALPQGPGPTGHGGMGLKDF